MAVAIENLHALIRRRIMAANAPRTTAIRDLDCSRLAPDGHGSIFYVIEKGKRSACAQVYINPIFARAIVENRKNRSLDNLLRL